MIRVPPVSCQVRIVLELSDFHLRLLRHVEAALLYDWVTQLATPPNFRSLAEVESYLIKALYSSISSKGYFSSVHSALSSSHLFSMRLRFDVMSSSMMDTKETPKQFHMLWRSRGARRTFTTKPCSRRHLASMTMNGANPTGTDGKAEDLRRPWSLKKRSATSVHFSDY